MAGDGNANSQNQLLNALSNLTQAVNAVGNQIGTVFPQGGAVAVSAGAASGKYLNVTGADGTPYKIALLLP